MPPLKPTSGLPHATESDALVGDRDFRLLAESIPNLAWIANPDGWLYWYNQRWYQYTGTTPQDMQGWGWQSVHDPAALPAVLEKWAACIATGEPFHMVFPLRGADGVFRPFLTRVMPLKDDHGAVTRWFGTNTDISRELQAAEDLRDSEARFRTATQAVSGILWTNNAAGEMQGEQPGWSAFTGQTLDQYQGYGWAAAVHPEDAQPTIDAWQICVRDQCLFAFQHRVRRHDGVYRLCSIRALPIHHPDGSIREWIGVHTDITQQKLSEDALIRNEKLAVAGRLAASIAHEINNPLEAVTNLLYLLLQTPLTEEQRDYALTMRGELSRVSQIATHTLRFHRQSTRPGTACPSDLIESVLGLFEGRLRNTGLNPLLRLRATGSICGFDGEIRQVIANLIGNAIDALAGIDPPCHLFIRTRNAVSHTTGQPGVLITIADNGSGMDPATRARIFEAFFTTKPATGTGLGLWVSHEIIQKHHGQLAIRSSRDPQHRGSTFRLFLPSASSPSTR